jgi:hypothetical protein
MTHGKCWLSTAIWLAVPGRCRPSIIDVPPHCPSGHTAVGSGLLPALAAIWPRLVGAHTVPRLPLETIRSSPCSGLAWSPTASTCEVSRAPRPLLPGCTVPVLDIAGAIHDPWVPAGGDCAAEGSSGDAGPRPGASVPVVNVVAAGHMRDARRPDGAIGPHADGARGPGQTLPVGYRGSQGCYPGHPVAERRDECPAQFGIAVAAPFGSNPLSPACQAS